MKNNYNITKECNIYKDIEKKSLDTSFQLDFIKENLRISKFRSLPNFIQFLAKEVNY